MQSVTFGFAAWPAAMILWSPGILSTPHRHPAMQLIMTLRGSLKIRGPAERWRRGQAAVIASNVIHTVDCRGTTVAVIYVHAQSELGVALSKLLKGDMGWVRSSLVSRWRDALGYEPTRDGFRRWIAGQLLTGRSSSRVEPRLRAVLTRVRSQILNEEFADFSLQTLASTAGLSASRFQHVFRREMGVPLRPYIRWLRLQRAAADLLDGVEISKAAHRAGFSDAAHMSRTFRRAMGLAPRDIAQAPQLCRVFFIEAGMLDDDLTESSSWQEQRRRTDATRAEYNKTSGKRH